MRGIGFRGMDISGKWHIGLVSESAGFPRQPECGVYISNMAGYPWAFQIRPETLGEYTGLRTDTGVRVFEGDIITIPNLVGKIHNHVDAVVFSNGTFHLEKCKDIIVCQELMDEGVSIIGNIYENPDLLEAK